jgi:hypothetical protein
MTISAKLIRAFKEYKIYKNEQEYINCKEAMISKPLYCLFRIEGRKEDGEAYTWFYKRFGWSHKYVRLNTLAGRFQQLVLLIAICWAFLEEKCCG